jgi:hypothetical protein
VNGLQGAAQDLLGLGPAGRAIAAAHLASDDGGAKGVFGAAVCRIDRRGRDGSRTALGFY